MKQIFLFFSFHVLFSAISMAQSFYIDNTLSSNTHKEYIITFLDAYKQAYKNQNINFIEFVFSEDAIIITETMELLKATEEQTNTFAKKKDRRYKTMLEDKRAYISRLKDAFKIGPVILDMADIKIMQHNKIKNIYGVNFTQAWYSETSADIESQQPGYVFLMIDFKNDIDNPVIHIKTWQPSATIKSPLDIYYLYDFQIFD